METLLFDDKAVPQVFDEKLRDQSTRLLKALRGIAAQSRVDGEDPLILPYYLVNVILTAPMAELSTGISKQSLLEQIRKLHHRSDKDSIRSSDITHLLIRLAAMQEDMHPPLLYYDSNDQRLKVVDASKFFVLTRINRDASREEIPNPLEKYEE